MNPSVSSLRPQEGWHVLHLFYSIERSAWSLLTSEERLQALTHLTQVLQDIRGHERTQVLTFSMVTERSEYTTTSEQKTEELAAAGHPAGSEESLKELAEFEARMKKYLSDRLYPNMSDWPVFCFYPMNKRREGADNWYALDFATRKKLMEGHARVGRGYAGKIRQLITGSTGLDEFEWFVTLQAKDTHDIKAIVYEMRFDEVSARYAEFGDFFIGLQLSLSEIFRRLCLHG